MLKEGIKKFLFVFLSVFSIFGLSSHIYHIKNEHLLKKILEEKEKKISKLEAEKNSLIISLKEIEKPKKSIKRKKRYISHSIPVGLPLKGVITSRFGYRPDPFTGEIRFHTGIDIKATYKQPVRATADGKVVFSGWKKGYGKVVIIKHKNGYETVYAHLSYKRVGRNQPVKAGQIIGYAGSTGRSTGVHLHYEIRKNGKPVNPIRYIYVKAKYRQEN